MSLSGLENICFIGGGQMAEALIKAVTAKRFMSPDAIFCSEPLEDRRKYLEKTYGIATFSDNKKAAAMAAIILLAVKPQVMDAVLADLKPAITQDKLVISIAAGITVFRLEAGLSNGTRVIRVMPNTPALVQEGAAALCRGTHAREPDMERALMLFGAVGKAVEVPESLMDAVTGLSGSGPAYCFMFMEALIQAGIREGLSRPVASELAVQTVLGSARMCQETNKEPGELVPMVTSPGGTTIHGMYHLYREGLFTSVMDAVRAAAERSRELGKK